MDNGPGQYLLLGSLPPRKNLKKQTNESVVARKLFHIGSEGAQINLNYIDILHFENQLYRNYTSTKNRVISRL